MTVASAIANIGDKAMLTGLVQLSKDMTQFTEAFESGTGTFEYVLNKFSSQVARAPHLIY
ncbi:MAG: hypothetical protein CM15mV78_500 [uncultured marine virus]|nr:MAG: hypothetical protein CM15mV78_500 [uncultured marine virus]